MGLSSEEEMIKKTSEFRSNLVDSWLKWTKEQACKEETEFGDEEEELAKALFVYILKKKSNYMTCFGDLLSFVIKESRFVFLHCFSSMKKTKTFLESLEEEEVHIGEG